jgi:TRAP-type mannitol/chloroaromatic compound transport system permease large subunit
MKTAMTAIWLVVFVASVIAMFINIMFEHSYETKIAAGVMLVSGFTLMGYNED